MTVSLLPALQPSPALRCLSRGCFPPSTFGQSSGRSTRADAHPRKQQAAAGLRPLQCPEPAQQRRQPREHGGLDEGGWLEFVGFQGCKRHPFPVSTHPWRSTHFQPSFSTLMPLTRPSHRGCNRTPSWTGLLSLGHRAYEHSIIKSVRCSGFCACGDSMFGRARVEPRWSELLSQCPLGFGVAHTRHFSCGGSREASVQTRWPRRFCHLWRGRRRCWLPYCFGRSSIQHLTPMRCI